MESNIFCYRYLYSDVYLKKAVKIASAQRMKPVMVLTDTLDSDLTGISFHIFSFAFLLDDNYAIVIFVITD